MTMPELKIAVRDIAAGFADRNEEGVVGYGGNLDIRPKYQREFVYDAKQRNAVIETMRDGCPLSIMYWAANGPGKFEVLDGQQRTLSICQYVNGDFSVEVDGHPKAFHNLPAEQQNEILDYELTVYVVEGSESKKLKWFKKVNVAGATLTDQELRNAVYTGPWLTAAKKNFSKTGCPAHSLSKNYVKGTPIRQDLLEKAIEWRSGGNIDQYMADHQHDPNANELWTYFKNVIDWVDLTFPNYRREMKGLDWGPLYDTFGGVTHDTQKLEEEIQELMIDDDVTNKKGIYAYILTHEERHLSIRAFSEAQKRQAYEAQSGICPGPTCGGKFFNIEDMQADHVTPWSKGGTTTIANCTMLCADCNRRKSNI